MKTLTRYILGEFLQVFLLALLGLTSLFFIGLVAKEALSKGLSLGPLMRMTPYILPQALPFALPCSMLLAATNVYGQLSSSNEIVAAKSLGVSPWRLVRPVFVFSVVTSLAAVAINDIAVSWGRMGVQRVFVESIEEVIYSQLRQHRSYASGKAQINVRRVEGRLLIRPTLTIQGEAGEAPLTVSAASAELRSDPQRHKLVATLRDFDVDGPVKVLDPTEFTYEFDLDQLVGDGDRGASSFSFAEISAEAQKTTKRLEDLRWEQETETTLAMMTGDFGRISTDAWKPYERLDNGLQYYMLRLHLEPYRRWSSGFSCLCFVMVGVPMAILRQKGEFLASFFLCFLPILIVYYPLLVASIDLAKSGDVPPVAVWIGNAVLAFWGLGMMRRVAMH